MEIRWQYYIVVNCALLYCGVAKPVSLNEVIAAESQQKQVAQTTLPPAPKLEETEVKSERFLLKKPLGRFSLNKPLERLSLNKSLERLSLHKPLERLSLNKALERFSLNKVIKPKKIKETSDISFLNQKITPFKYRKTFEIKSPLKPKRIKQSLRTRQRRKNQSVKREISGNEKYNKKYIPLLKSLSMLFDNILGPDSSESDEIQDKRRRVRYYTDTEEVTKTPCRCTTKSDSEEKYYSQETRVISTETVSEIPTTTETASETSITTAPSNTRSFRQNKNVPLLLSRNTFSTRRNNNGLGKRSRTANNRGHQRYISGNNGDNERNTSCGQDESCSENDENTTDGDSRDDASRIRSRIGIRRRDRYNTEDQTERNITNEDNVTETKIAEDTTGGDFDEFKTYNKHEIGIDETESAKLLSEPARRLREFVSEDKIDVTTESIPVSEEINEKDTDVADYTSNQRILDGSSQLTEENQKPSQRNETLAPLQIDELTTKPTRKGPVVVIIDGYSVTRHKNGENKLSNKAIRIHSQ